LKGALWLTNPSPLFSYTQTKQLLRQTEEGKHAAEEKVKAAHVSLVPIVLHSCLNLCWMASNDSLIVNSETLFLPFMCFWGVGYAYHVVSDDDDDDNDDDGMADSVSLS